MLVEQLQKHDRQKNDFLATLAHELSNPLAAISNAVMLITMSDDKEHRGAGQAGLHQAITIEHEDERRGAQKRSRDEQRHGRRCDQRRQSQSRAGGFLEIIDQALKHIKAPGSQ